MSWASRGLASAVALVIVAINFLLLREHCDLKILEGIERAQQLHIAAGVFAAAGISLHVLMLRGCLKNPVCRIITAGVQLAAAGFCVAAAYFVFANPCRLGDAIISTFRRTIGEQSNVFQAEDGKMIVIFALDLFSALIVGGSTFLRSS